LRAGDEESHSGHEFADHLPQRRQHSTANGDIINLGAAGVVNIESGAMDIEQVKRDFGDRIRSGGSIDLQYTLTQDTPEDKVKVPTRF